MEKSASNNTTAAVGTEISTARLPVCFGPKMFNTPIMIIAKGREDFGMRHFHVFKYLREH